ncbi:MAG TPA: glycosyltransferase, partial [Candidatus Bathyarchaeia archaeon]|nr:glycosyltransferase [Candidatus Bathyarchaeia archaeon]
MASGCPVVSTTVGAEGLGATANEICIRDGAPAIAAAVADLLADEGKRRALARAAHRFVAARYDWPGIAARLLDAYGFRRRPLHRLAEAG